jgi:hypothetical protein
MSAVAMLEETSRLLENYRIHLDMACRVGTSVEVLRHYERRTAFPPYTLELEPEPEVDSWYRIDALESCKGRTRLEEQERQDQERYELVDNPVDWLPLLIDPSSGSGSCLLKEAGMVDLGKRCMAYQVAGLYRVRGTLRSIACPFRACVLAVGRTDRLWVDLQMDRGTCHWLLEGLGRKTIYQLTIWLYRYCQ